MTNTEIIANALKARGMTDDQLQQLMDAYRGDLPFHTLPEWNRRGYRVKTGEKAFLICDLWKHTSKPSKATIQAAEEAGKAAPETSPHFYKKTSYVFSFSQVEKAPPVPDLATLRQQLQNLPGLIFTVKGEKTASPVVWLTGDTAQHKDTIKANGGQWSAKKSAWYIKPSTASAAPVPSMMEDAPAAAPAPRCTALVPAPCTALIPYVPQCTALVPVGAAC